MDCPNGIRQCPNGWTDCDLCANYERCKAGIFEVEEDVSIVEKAAEISEIVVHKEAVESAHKIRETWYEAFDKMTEDERWAAMRKYHPPSLHDKEPLPLDGGVVPGGGSKSKNHKKPNKKTPEYMKYLGM